MQYNEIQKTEQKSIRMEIDLIETIEKLRKGTERSFAQQVKFMLREYIRIKENN